MIGRGPWWTKGAEVYLRSPSLFEPMDGAQAIAAVHWQPSGHGSGASAVGMVTFLMEAASKPGAVYANGPRQAALKILGGFSSNQSQINSFQKKRFYEHLLLFGHQP